MNWLLTAALLQYVISATAGLVNQVRGPANVQRDQIVAAGKPIETGRHGFVEIQLNPGTYLRLRENSSVVFDSVVLESIEARLASGTMLVDSEAVEPASPVKIAAGQLVGFIREPGLYRFSRDHVRVLDGRLELSNGTEVRKGYEAVLHESGIDIFRIWGDEVSRPYAPDKVKIFVEPSDDENHHRTFMNSLFAELSSRELAHSRDVAVVTDRQSADFTLVISGGRQLVYGRVFVHGELLENPPGKNVFSGTATRLEYDHTFLQPSREAVRALLVQMHHQMHWR